MACGLTQYYNLQGLTCYSPLLVSNVKGIAASHRYIQHNNFTLNNIELAINSSVLPVLPCQASAPLFNGTSCFACISPKFYNLIDSKCFSTQLSSNVSALNATGRYVNIGSFTLVNLENNISSQVLPSATCPASQPLFNGSVCLNLLNWGPTMTSRTFNA